MLSKKTKESLEDAINLSLILTIGGCLFIAGFFGVITLVQLTHKCSLILAIIVGIITTLIALSTTLFITIQITDINFFKKIFKEK